MDTSFHKIPWWRHQMETFSALLALCAGNSPVTSEFPAQRPVTWSFDVFFDLRLNQQLSKQWSLWWFEMPPRSLWRHCNAFNQLHPTWIGHPYKNGLQSVIRDVHGGDGRDGNIWPAAHKDTLYLLFVSCAIRTVCSPFYHGWKCEVISCVIYML